MIGYYGNHNKRKGDIVQIARWEAELLEKFERFYEVKPGKIDEVKFIVMTIDHHSRTVGIIPEDERIKQVIGRIHLDDTSLIRVGRMSE